MANVALLVYVRPTHRNGQRQGDFFQGHVFPRSAGIGGGDLANVSTSSNEALTLPLPLSASPLSILGVRAAAPPAIHHCCLPHRPRKDEHDNSDDDDDVEQPKFYDITVADHDARVEYHCRNVMRYPGDAIRLSTTYDNDIVAAHRDDGCAEGQQQQQQQQPAAPARRKLAAVLFDTHRLLAGKVAKEYVWRYFPRLAQQVFPPHGQHGGAYDDSNDDDDNNTNDDDAYAVVVCLGEIQLSQRAPPGEEQAHPAREEEGAWSDVDNLPIKTSDIYRDLYGVLNCTPDNSIAQISVEYKRLALLHHPDKTATGSDDAFQLIQQAYGVLSDPEAKREYDTWLHSGLQVPFVKWKALGSQASSTHWSGRPLHRRIDQSQPQPPPSVHTTQKTGNQDALYAKFRNYEL
ncbi:DnaJ subfamily C member 12 [Sorochytrium milnesiophthora]